MVSLGLMTLITALAVTPIKVGSLRLYTLTLILSLPLLWYSVPASLELYNSYICIDNFRLLLIVLSLLVGVLTISSLSDLGSLVLLSLLGTIFLISSNHLLTIIVALELQSFTSYALAFLSRSSSNGASLKYLLLGAVASAFIMLSIALIYVTTGLLDFNSLQQWEFSGFSSLALVLFLVGAFFKLGLAPFHQWTPDVYGTVTSSTMAYISLVPKVGILGLITIMLWPQYNSNLILFIGALSMIVGSVGGLAQTEYRRLLAYSSITHMGYLLIAALCCTPSVLLIYIYQYCLTTLCVLYCFRLLDPIDTGKLSTLTSSLNSQPYVAGLLGVLIFSLAGVPPIVGFFVKLEVFYALISDGHYITIMVAVITSVIGAFYYLRVIMFMLTTKITLDQPLTNTTLNKYLLVLGVGLITLVVLEGTLLEQYAQLMAQQSVSFNAIV